MSWWSMVPTWAQTLIAVMSIPWAFMVLVIYVIAVDRILHACDRGVSRTTQRVRRWQKRRRYARMHSPSRDPEALHWYERRPRAQTTELIEAMAFSGETIIEDERERKRDGATWT